MLRAVDSGYRTAERAGPCFGFFMNMLLWGMRNARNADAAETAKAEGTVSTAH
jgi:hypothetical protein